GKVMTTVSRTPPNSVRRLLPLTRRQRTRRSNNNAGALTIFWKSDGPTFSKNRSLKRGPVWRASRAFHACARADEQQLKGARRKGLARARALAICTVSGREWW